MAISKFETVLGIYTVVGMLGEGGSGRVYEVRDEDGAAFAIKLLNPAAATLAKRRRFKNELAFAQRNTHPNIITVLDYGTVVVKGEVSPFFVMPFYASSLRELIARRTPPQEVVALFLQVLDGVEAAHLQSIVHRDLKPENILFDPNGRKIVVADFGIARFTEDVLVTLVETRPNERLANFEYAAPEQRRRGGSTDTRTDIYALGLILYEMFTGEVPHGTGCPLIGDAHPDYAYVDTVIESMRAQVPERRPPSIASIKHQLATLGQIAVTQQKLSILKDTVIPESTVDDPLVADPIRVVRRDYTDGRLLFIFQKPATQRWFDCFTTIDWGTSAIGKRPSAFSFHTNAVSIDVDDENKAKEVIQLFEPWIPRANEKYRSELEQEQHAKDERQCLTLKRRIEEKERQQRILRVIQETG